MNWTKSSWMAPGITVIAATMALGLWAWPRQSGTLQPRVPGTDAAPVGESAGGNPVQKAKLVPGDGQPSPASGNWPQFRGPNRDGVAVDSARLSRDWKSTPPRKLWSLDVGEGYAGVALHDGRVYLLDYDRDAKQSALRCLSLVDGREIWRFGYPLTIKRNHGMTRTVPALADELVVALDSKCNVVCLDALSGELKWTVSLVHDFGATVPEWYAGQCPLIDGGRVILAPGGKDALVIALDLATGKPVWQSPNPHDWKMTHSSIMPMDFADKRLYVYCANKGVVGVDASDGKLLWETTDWKISIATVPSPLPLTEGRIFLTGGYGAGSMMLQLENQGNQFAVRTLFKLTPEVFGATQHTPVFKEDHLYGARADNRFVCLDLDGKVSWASGTSESFGLGSFLFADDLIFALNDSGKLRMFEAFPGRFNLLGECHPLAGRESWAPMAFAGNLLLLRDLTRLVCLELPVR